MRLLKVVVILGVIICICVVGGLTGINYLANRIIDESIAEMVKVSTEVLTPNNSEPPKEDSISAEDTTISDYEAAIKEPTKNDVKETTSKTAEQTKVNKTPVESSVPEPSATGISNSKLKEASQQVPINEKVEITKIVVSRLSASEISKLSAMLAGGISEEEKRTAKEIVYSSFTSEEIEHLKSLYYKYTR